MFDELPSIAHLVYIPGVLLVGVSLGFRLGAKAVRAELERAQKAKKR